MPREVQWPRKFGSGWYVMAWERIFRIGIIPITLGPPATSQLWDLRPKHWSCSDDFMTLYFPHFRQLFLKSPLAACLWTSGPSNLPTFQYTEFTWAASNQLQYVTMPNLTAHLLSLFPLMFCQFQYWIFTAICFLFSSCWNVEPCYILEKQLTESSTNLSTSAGFQWLPFIEQ